MLGRGSVKSQACYLLRWGFNLAVPYDEAWNLGKGHLELLGNARFLVVLWAELELPLSCIPRCGIPMVQEPPALLGALQMGITCSGGNGQI